MEKNPENKEINIIEELTSDQKSWKMEVMDEKERLKVPVILVSNEITFQRNFSTIVE